jgi:hypothetical protein
MKRIVRLTESDLTRLVKRVIKEYRPYGKSLQDLEDSFWNKDEFLGDMQWGLHNKVYEPNKQKHYEKLNNLKTYYADKMVYDFLQNPNFTSEENTKLEELDEKLSNPNLGSDKIERFKNLKREIYVNAFDRYLDTLDKRHLDQYFIGQKYPYFKDKIKDFVYTGNAPSEPMTPNPNFIQRAAKKVKGYFGSSENEKLTESDLTRIVRRVIRESDEESQEFVVTDDTSVDELESYLDGKIEDNYSYGSESTLPNIVNNLVYNSLLSSGKSEENATSIADDFTESRMDSDTTSIPDEFDMYERRTEGENSFDYEVIFEFSCGGDGYGFSGSFNNLTGLLDGIKELLNQ